MSQFVPNSEFRRLVSEAVPAIRLKIDQSLPSIQEQTGTDPISKLAAAVNRLADALEGLGG